MNSKLLFPIVIVALVLAGAGCNKSGKLNTPSSTVPPPGPVELKIKWTPGEQAVQEMDMKQTMEMNLPGQPGPTKQNMNMGQKFLLTVLNADADGGHEVGFEFQSSRFSMDMGGKTMMDYDSEKHSSADNQNPLVKTFGNIIGAKIQYFLDASNNVERVEGVDDLVNRLSTSDPRQAAIFKSMYNEDMFKQYMSSERYLPPMPVQPGDTWPLKMDVPMGGFGTLSLNYTVTFKGWEMHGKRNCARLEFDGTINSTPGDKAGPIGIKMAIQNGDTSGVSWFDPELGIIIDSKASQDMTMVMTFPKNPRAQPSANMPMQTITNEMTQEINVKLDSVN